MVGITRSKVIFLFRKWLFLSVEITAVEVSTPNSLDIPQPSPSHTWCFPGGEFGSLKTHLKTSRDLWGVHTKTILTMFLDGLFGWLDMGVSKNRGTPKWMVKIMENPIKMDDLGVPLLSETSI